MNIFSIRSILALKLKSATCVNRDTAWMQVVTNCKNQLFGFAPSVGTIKIKEIQNALNQITDLASLPRTGFSEERGELGFSTSSLHMYSELHSIEELFMRICRQRIFPKDFHLSYVLINNQVGTVAGRLDQHLIKPGPRVSILLGIQRSGRGIVGAGNGLIEEHSR